MQGLQLFRHFTNDDNATARVLFRRALELDPNYAMGLVWLAWTYWSDALPLDGNARRRADPCR